MEKITWTAFKAYLILNPSLSVQFVDLGSYIKVEVFNGVFTVSTHIGVDDTTDLTDFQTNFQSSFNQLFAEGIRGGTTRAIIGNVGDSLKTNITASVLPTGASTSSLQTTGNTTLTTISTRVGNLTDPAPANDTASSSLNGRLQRIAQRLTSIFTGQSDGSQQSKIRGDSTGTLVGNVEDSLKVTDIPSISGLNSELTVGTTAIEVKVGANKLVNRKYILLRPKDNSIYFGYSNAVTITSGMRMFKDELLIFPCNVSVWVIADGAGRKLSIGELS